MSSPHGIEDRRQFPRIRVFEDLKGRVMPLDDPMRVHDISQGGFAVETPMGFIPGSEHQFEFTMPDGTLIVLWATAVHCMRVNRPDDAPLYFGGFAFNRVQAGDRKVIESFVNAVAVGKAGRP
jgi:hypothetical protein